jgi:hypothetical protein
MEQKPTGVKCGPYMIHEGVVKPIELLYP